MLRAAAYRTVAILVLSVLAFPARADVVAWIQLGGGDKISARAIVEDGGCPSLYRCLKFAGRLATKAAMPSF
jgi:hypothetical protein